VEYPFAVLAPRLRQRLACVAQRRIVADDCAAAVDGDEASSVQLNRTDYNASARHSRPAVAASFRSDVARLPLVAAGVKSTHSYSLVVAV
jgi:hypothetical protein